jgi:hypothetical protein
MGVNIHRNRSVRSDRDRTAFLVILGLLALSTVLSVWAGMPRVVPPTFGTGGGIIVISLSLIAVMAAPYSRRRAKWPRRVVGTVTLLLALAAELLALGQLTSGRGAADTVLGWVLSAGVVAMIGLALRGLKGVPG